MLSNNQLAKLRSDIRFTAELGGRTLVFHSTWGLFSPREIDEGTLLLLRHIEVNPDDDCLDLGCGYGPIGLSLAVRYSNGNAERNGIDNAHAQLSNGFDQIAPDLRFDLIASNVPAKVGKEMLSLYLHDARARLRQGGRLYLVSINGLRQFLKRNLTEVFGNYEKCKQGAHYTVALARKSLE